jgi:hypothetical protein
MRLLILAAAATLVTGTAMAAQHHHRNANASIAKSSAPVSSAPADTRGARDLYVKNLHDSGHNPASDVDAAGYFKTN